MAQAQVVDRFEADGLSVEVFADGDCILSGHLGGFLHLSVKHLARMTQSTSSNSMPDIDQVMKSTKVKRKITGKKGGQWECVLTEPGVDPVRHVYASRQQARLATSDTPIGDGGRLL